MNLNKSLPFTLYLFKKQTIKFSTLLLLFTLLGTTTSWGKITVTWIPTLEDVSTMRTKTAGVWGSVTVGSGRESFMLYGARAINGKDGTPSFDFKNGGLRFGAQGDVNRQMEWAGLVIYIPPKSKKVLSIDVQIHSVKELKTGFASGVTCPVVATGFSGVLPAGETLTHTFFDTYPKEYRYYVIGGRYDYILPEPGDTRILRLDVTFVEMLCEHLYDIDQIKAVEVVSGNYAEGLSDDGVFTTFGAAASGSAPNGTPEITTESAEIDGIAFSSAMRFKGAPEMTGDLPDSRAISFDVPDEGDSLTIYYQNGQNLRLLKEGGTAATVGTSGNGYATLPVEGGNTYYLYATDENAALFGMNLRCVCVFTNKAGDDMWGTVGNWYPTYSILPDALHNVRIERPCVVNVAAAKASSIKLRNDDTQPCIDCDLAGHGAYNLFSEGDLTIQPTAALRTDSVRLVQGTNFKTVQPIQQADLSIQASAAGNGAFAFADTEPTLANVQYYSKGAGAGNGDDDFTDIITDLNTVTWQYMGIPLTSVAQAVEPFQGAWMCSWQEGSTGLGASWHWVKPTDPLAPFSGYAFTQAAPKTYNLSGNINPAVNKSWSISNSGGNDNYQGFNLLANSWTAPINIGALEATDFGTAEQTIYIFNSGTYQQWQNGTADATGASTTAGNYVAIPRNLVGVTGLNAIPPMQGFFVYTAAATTFTVPYQATVYGAFDYEMSISPMRAPAARNENVLSLQVNGKRFADKVYLVSGNDDFTEAFDNGYDARKMFGIATAPQLFVLAADGNRAVAAVPDMDGRFLGFRAGEDSEYTIHFGTSEQGLYLHDLQTDAVVPIETGGSYTFAASNSNYVARRFKISQSTTIAEGDKTQLRIYNEGKILVIENYTESHSHLQLYDVQGRLVRNEVHTKMRCKIPLADLPSGIYVARVRTTTEVKSVKIIF